MPHPLSRVHYKFSHNDFRRKFLNWFPCDLNSAFPLYLQKMGRRNHSSILTYTYNPPNSVLPSPTLRHLFWTLTSWNIAKTIINTCLYGLTMILSSFSSRNSGASVVCDLDHSEEGFLSLTGFWTLPK